MSVPGKCSGHVTTGAINESIDASPSFQHHVPSPLKGFAVQNVGQYPDTLRAGILCLASC